MIFLEAQETTILLKGRSAETRTSVNFACRPTKVCFSVSGICDSQKSSLNAALGPTKNGLVQLILCSGLWLPQMSVPVWPCRLLPGML